MKDFRCYFLPHEHTHQLSLDHGKNLLLYNVNWRRSDTSWIDTFQDYQCGHSFLVSSWWSRMLTTNVVIGTTPVCTVHLAVRNEKLSINNDIQQTHWMAMPVIAFGMVQDFNYSRERKRFYLYQLIGMNKHRECGYIYLNLHGNPQVEWFNECFIPTQPTTKYNVRIQCSNSYLSSWQGKKAPTI